MAFVHFSIRIIKHERCGLLDLIGKVSQTAPSCIGICLEIFTLDVNIRVRTHVSGVIPVVRRQRSIVRSPPLMLIRYDIYFATKI